MSDRNDATIVLQAGLNVLNGNENTIEFFGFVPVYDDLLDPSVRDNGSLVNPSDSVDNAIISAGNPTLDDFNGAFYFKQGTSKFTFKERGYAYGSATSGFVDIQGTVPALGDNALPCGGTTSAFSNAEIQGGEMTGSPWTEVSTSGWSIDNVWKSIARTRQITEEGTDVHFNQYTITLDSNEMGDVIFNKVLVFVSGGDSGVTPIAVIALANPVVVRHESGDTGGVSSFSILFSIGFTANLSQIPVHIVGNTSGYWGYADKTSVDVVNPIAYQGRLFVGIPPTSQNTNTESFITMYGDGTSGLNYVDYFADTTNNTMSYREIGGSIINTSGEPISGFEHSIFVGTNRNFGLIKDSLVNANKMAFTTNYDEVLTHSSSADFTTSAQNIDNEHPSWGGWGFTETSGFRRQVNHSIYNGYSPTTSNSLYVIGIQNSVVNVIPDTNAQGFRGILAINSVLVGRGQPKCENSVFVGSLNIGGNQGRIPFLSNSLVVGSNNLIMRTSYSKDNGNKVGHYIRSQKPIVILGHDNSISADNDISDTNTYSAYVFGSNVSATFGDDDCGYPHFILGDGFTASNYEKITDGSTYAREIWPMFEIGSSDNSVGFVVGKTSVAAAGPVNFTNTLIQIKNMVEYRSGLPSGSLYVKTENGTNYVCIV